MEEVSQIEAVTELLTYAEPETVPPIPSWRTSLWQVMRFGIVGGLNTAIDLLVFNVIIFCFPTQMPALLVTYNAFAYATGALNSYILNKFWTFKHTQAIKSKEVGRFVLINAFGILCNSILVGLISISVSHSLLSNTLIWANTAKVLAILGTSTLSYLGMRLWVFADKFQIQQTEASEVDSMTSDVPEKDQPEDQDEQVIALSSPSVAVENHTFLTTSSLSIVLPAYNEDAIIAQTIHTVITTLTPWVEDFEVIVVNDGSKDDTQSVLEAIMPTDKHLRIIHHEENRGYGAALISGFEAATKDLTFFMDSDGQFDIRDLAPFFRLIEQYDVVLGYRIHRQDTWLRKTNAWGWKSLIYLLFHVNVRDIDCAFKLYHTDFLRLCHPETQGAMINTEILYKLQRSGYTYTQLGVHHLPRTSGHATGANLAVIMRAFRELFVCARKWYKENPYEKGAL